MVNSEPISSNQDKIQESPVEVSSESRRNFLTTGLIYAAMSAAYTAGIGYVVFKFMTSGLPEDESAKLSKVKIDLKPDELSAKGYQMFKFGSKPSILIKQADGTYTAFSAVCTHLGCNVSYQADKDRIFCACHGGIYDPKTGKNVAGPPPEPLPVYKVVEAEDGLYVERA